MKKQILIALVGTALAAPFAVQAQTSYVGVNVGRAEQKVTIDGFFSEKESDTGFKLYGGMAIDKTFGGEIGYVDLGKAERANVVGSASAKTRALYVAGTATFPLNEQFSLSAKAGVSFNRVKSRATLAGGPTDSSTDSRASLLLGVGAAYNFAPNLSAVLEYENFGKVLKEDNAKIKADMVSVGIRYKF